MKTQQAYMNYSLFGSLIGTGDFRLFLPLFLYGNGGLYYLE